MTGAGGLPFDPGDPAVQAVGATVAIALLLLVAMWRAMARSARATRAMARNMERTSQRLRDLSDQQALLSGGLRAVGEAQAASQARNAAALDRRLEDVSRHLDGSANRTARSLGALQARLAAIDSAQAKLERLSGDVLGLQHILSNKQARGAFGEIQLADLVAQMLPPDAYQMQAVLPNGRRADCLIRLPDPPGPLAIDSKFPLEAYEALVAAEDEGARKGAARAFRAAVRGHLRDIASRYIVPGTTGDGALMFVPSEAVYAELHARFGELVREGFALKVWTVSPTTCMATLTTLRAVLKDVRLREQAGALRHELSRLAEEVAEVETASRRLQRHFAGASTEIDTLTRTAATGGARARRLADGELGAVDDPAPAVRSAGTAVPDAAE